MKLTNEEKCTYCREYGNLPCDECNEKLEAKKAMSKTKFTKVAVSENPPEEGTVQMFLTEGGLRKVILYRAKWFQEERYSLYKYYLVESPDREDDMIEMLERTFNLCDKLQFPTEKQLSDLKTEIESLLQCHYWQYCVIRRQNLK